MSFSHIWLSEFVVIKLVLSAYRTGLGMLDIALGKSLTYNRKIRGPSMDPWRTPSVIDFHLEENIFEL
jgi:hypothetical protein